MTPQAFIMIGRSGSGKGTQATLLMEFLKKKDPERSSIYVETGKELREFTKEGHYAGQITKNVIDHGGLMPSFVPIYIWTNLLKRTFTGNEHIVFDGTPRKPIEAQALDGLFPFFKMGKPFVVYLDVEHEEATNRLTKRARGDDSTEAIAKRQAWFESDVKPCVDYYRTNPNATLLDIDGHGTIQEVHDRIVKKAGLS